MKKKYTYKPTSSVKYGKGGKNKKKSYRDNYSKETHGNHFFDLSWLSGPLADLFGIDSMKTYLEGIESSAQLQQDQAGVTGYEMVSDVDGLGQLTPEASATLTDYRDQIGISRPKKTSTEFMEGIKDTIGQQTTGVLSDIGRTGKMTGIKDVLGSTDQALIQAQEKGAAMDERYQQQLTDIEKFETGQETQIVGQIGQQEFASDQSVYDLAGDLAAQSAAAGGDLEASAIAGLVDLQGQQAAATADLLSGAFDTILGFFDPTSFLPSDKKLKKNIKKVGETESGVPVSDFDYKKDKDAPEGPGRYRGVIAQDLMGTEHEDAVVKKDKNTLGVDYDMLDIQLQKIEEKGKKQMKAESGAKMQQYEEGAKQNMMTVEEADVTPGKFSHEDNPIDIVQGGEKIGEMTGGEAIVPLRDVKELESFIAEGDKDSVFNKIKKLFIKWDKKAREHAEKDLDQEQEAMGGAKIHYKPKSKINYR